jgi:hypothetical protein
MVPGILIDLPACPDMLAERELKNAAIDFCKRAGVWRTQLAAIAVAVNDNSFALASPVATTRVVRALDVLYVIGTDKKRLDPITVPELNESYPNWKITQGSISKFTQEVPDALLTDRMADTAGTLEILASIAPTQASTGFDDWVAEEFYEAIQHGALKRAMEIPGKEWSNPQLALYHESKFEDAINRATAQAGKMYQAYAPIHTKTYGR